MSQKTKQATELEIFLAGLGALAASRNRFESLKSEGEALLQASEPDEVREPVDLLPLLGAGMGGPALQGVERLWTIDREELSDRMSSTVRLIAETRGRLERRELRDLAPQRLVQQLRELIEAMMPRDVPTSATVLQARRNSEARTTMLEEFGLLSSGDVAEISGSAAKNRAALASRWKSEGRIFSVIQRGASYYPGFQFDSDGRPRPLVAQILEILGTDAGWETALWFVASNGYLEGRRPVDLMDEAPDQVLAAARAEAAEVRF